MKKKNKNLKKLSNGTLFLLGLGTYAFIVLLDGLIIFLRSF